MQTIRPTITARTARPQIQARAIRMTEEAERQFKTSLVLMALIGSACIATTFATIVQMS